MLHQGRMILMQLHMYERNNCQGINIIQIGKKYGKSVILRYRRYAGKFSGNDAGFRQGCVKEGTGCRAQNRTLFRQV